MIRLSPKSRTQALKEQHQASQENSNDFLLPSNAGHLSVPRTPGVDGNQVRGNFNSNLVEHYKRFHLQTGRIRKCSIVQEEEDDEDDDGDDESITLNRRGSRSEGRINVTVQDRIAAEAERLKKETTSACVPPRSLFDGLSGVTMVTSDADPKEKLGVFRRNTNFKPRTIESPGKSRCSNERSNSVDHEHFIDPRKNADIVSTIFLTDSSTISIPIPSQNIPQVSISKYKTMPSPTRANTILPGSNCLNEIFEEGTDVGSSDSATTTPRPVTRHTHYVSNRTQSQGSGAHRRSKFHKTRTASCSSSDASDDDSENRKKRAHKIVDSTKPLTPQRRDSHDDSSDSQDPGNAASSGTNTSATSCSIQPIVDPKHSPEQTNESARQNGDGNSNNRQKSGQQVGFRRHRAGRRRAGETRLRESQSLNRITEVQESEVPLTNLAHQQQQTNTVSNNERPNPVPQPTKSRGFSARLFHGFRNKPDNTTSTGEVPRIPSNQSNGASDEMEMVLGVELAKALKVTESKSSSATKKLKMLGKYFQVYRNDSTLIC